MKPPSFDYAAPQTCPDRAREDPRRVMAYRNAADIVEGLSEADRERHGAANSWQSLSGIGPKTAKVIAQAWAGREPDALAELRSAAKDLGGDIRAALRGDLDVHSNWSDGSAPIDDMMLAAKELGHEYCALTDSLSAPQGRERAVSRSVCGNNSTSSTSCAKPWRR